MKRMRAYDEITDHQIDHIMRTMISYQGGQSQPLLTTQTYTLSSQKETMIESRSALDDSMRASLSSSKVLAQTYNNFVQEHLNANTSSSYELDA